MGISKKSNKIKIPLEEQLEQLRQLGISPCCEDFTDWILTEWSREDFETDPYNLLLFSLGSERNMDGKWAPISNDIYCLDTECVENDDIYAQVFMNLSRISKGEFMPYNVTSSVDHDAGKAEVSFANNGKSYHWDLEYNGDWLDGSIFHRINDLLGENERDRMFYIANPDQSVHIIYNDRKQVEQVNMLVSSSFLDTAYSPAAQKQPATKTHTAVASPKPVPAARPKKKRGIKEVVSDSYEFIGLACGLLLIAVCCIYQQLAGRAANDTAVNIMFILGFVILIVSMFLRYKKQKRTPVKAAATEHIELTPEETAECMEVLAPTVQPYIRLATHRGPVGVYDSKFGGTPYLPPNFEYPYDASTKLPLKLLCQLNFEQLPHLLGFPERGILQFYIACEPSKNTDFMYGLDFDNRCKQAKWRVIYHRDIVADEALLQSPPELVDEKDCLFPFTGELALEAELSEMPLICSDYRWDNFKKNVWDTSDIGQKLKEKYIIYDVELLIAEAVDAYRHKIGGYPHFAQDDARFYNYKEHTVLLLQIDSDHDIMWGDAGVANFFITPESLEKCDFSNVMYNWDCY